MLDVFLWAAVATAGFAIYGHAKSSSRARWKAFAEKNGWTLRDKRRIQATWEDRTVLFTHDRRMGTHHSDTRTSIEIQLPVHLPGSTMQALMKLDPPPRIPLSGSVKDLNTMWKDLKAASVELNVKQYPREVPLIPFLDDSEGWMPQNFPGTSWLQLFGPYSHYPDAQAERLFGALRTCFHALENTLLLNLRRLAESEQWRLDLGETWTATDAHGHTVLQISHEPYRAIFRRPLPPPIPPGLRIYSRESAGDGASTGNLVLDQFLRIELDDPSQVRTLSDHSGFCEAILELVQGLGAEVDQDAIVFTRDELLLEPSKIWQQLGDLARAVAAPWATDST